MKIENKQEWVIDKLHEHYTDLGLSAMITVNYDEDNRIEVLVKPSADEVYSAYYISQDFLESEHLEKVVEARIELDKSHFSKEEKNEEL